jgi:hypothetical protein
MDFHPEESHEDPSVSTVLYTNFNPLGKIPHPVAAELASVITLNPAMRDRVKSGHRGGRRHDCFTLHRCVSARIRFC